MENTRKPIQSKKNQYYSSAEKEEDVDAMCPLPRQHLFEVYLV